MMNLNELESKSHMLVEQRRQEADMYRLAQVAKGQSAPTQAHKQPYGYITQRLRGVIAFRRVVWSHV